MESALHIIDIDSDMIVNNNNNQDKTGDSCICVLPPWAIYHDVII